MNKVRFNYQFKKVLCIIGYLIVYDTLNAHQALAAEPNQSETALRDQINNQQHRQDSSEKYFSAVVKKFSMPNNISSAFTEKLKDNHLFDSKRTPAQDVNGFFYFLSGFVYDSDNPGPFFDHLITSQSSILSIQAQLIACGEKLLGPHNSMVVQLKQAHQDNLKSIEALKQQKLQIEQTAKVKPVPVKQR